VQRRRRGRRRDASAHIDDVELQSEVYSPVKSILHTPTMQTATATATTLEDETAGLRRRSSFAASCSAIEARARSVLGRDDEADNVGGSLFVRAGRRVATTLRTRYGDASGSEWEIGERAMRACAAAARDAREVTLRTSEEVEALKALERECEEVSSLRAEAMREDGERKNVGKENATTAVSSFEGQFTTGTLEAEEGLDEDFSHVSNAALRLILAARRRAMLDGGVGSFLETDFAESVRVEHESHKAAASVSVEALRYRKPTADEVAQKCSICFDDFVEEDTVVSMPCSSRHVFHERCVKEWLSRDDSCPLCRSSLPVWLGRPQYS